MRDGLPPLRPYAKEPSLYLGEVSHLRFLSSNTPVSLALHKGVVGSIAKRDAATLGTWAERLHGEFLCAIHTALGGHVLPGNRTGNAWPMGPSAFACSKGWDVLRPYLVGLGCHQRSANPHQRMAVYAYLRIACSKSATHVCTVYDNLLHIYVTFRIQGKPHTIATVALRSLRHISVGVTFASVAVCKSSHSSGPMQVFPPQAHTSETQQALIKQLSPKALTVFLCPFLVLFLLFLFQIVKVLFCYRRGQSFHHSIEITHVTPTFIPLFMF